MAQSIQACLTIALVANVLSGYWPGLAIAQEAEPLTFSLENYTEVPLIEFYVTLPSAEDWNNELLRGRTVPARSAISVTVDNLAEDCLYDILAVFDDGEYIEENDIDLCDVDNGSYAYYDTDSFVQIENNADVAITEFYYSPAPATAWGENVFAVGGDSAITIEPGTWRDIPIYDLECLDDASAFYDFRAVFVDGEEVVVEQIDICSENASVVFFED